MFLIRGLHRWFGVHEFCLNVLRVYFFNTRRERRPVTMIPMLGCSRLKNRKPSAWSLCTCPRIRFTVTCYIIVGIHKHTIAIMLIIIERHIFHEWTTLGLRTLAEHDTMIYYYYYETRKRYKCVTLRIRLARIS